RPRQTRGLAVGHLRFHHGGFSCARLDFDCLRQSLSRSADSRRFHRAVSRTSLDRQSSQMGVREVTRMKQGPLIGVQACVFDAYAGLRTAILSNGSPNMLDAAVKAAGLKLLLDAVLSVEEVGVYKPHPKVYQLAVDRLGVGRLRRLGIRDAGRMVQSLRATAGAIAGRARPNGEISGRTAGPGRSVIDVNAGAIRRSCDAQLAEGGGKIIKLGCRARGGAQ